MRLAWLSLYELCERFLSSGQTIEWKDLTPTTTRSCRELKIDCRDFPVLCEHLKACPRNHRKSHFCDLVRNAAPCLEWSDGDESYRIRLPKCSPINKEYIPSEPSPVGDQSALADEILEEKNEAGSFTPVEDDEDLDDFEGLISF